MWNHPDCFWNSVEVPVSLGTELNQYEPPLDGGLAVLLTFNLEFSIWVLCEPYDKKWHESDAQLAAVYIRKL